MGQTKKTDSSYFGSKLDLRRYFLRRYHAAKPPAVLDCCEGQGRLWTKLRAEFALASLVGIDTKRRPGRLRIDSARLLERPGWAFDVIDVDTYGSPFRHLLQIMRNMVDPVTVFLTWGIVRVGGGGNVQRDEAAIMGLATLRKHIPATLLVLAGGRLSLSSCFRVGAERGVRVTEAIEAFPNGRARYIGLRLEPPAGRRAGRKVR